ncbi:hypothetical protein COT68_02325 [bacterium (Candidatus Torokbacteria) CG09_land_8_20_14_0_10_42_11]|nr:MAG: hypothetical protein COT68_02325 [bacterium (Candidatus Torokbacteria) CG09_land_8_20_14_0_10_42_11]
MKFENQPTFLKKGIIFLLIGVAMLGVIIFWWETFDWQREEQSFLKNVRAWKKIWQATNQGFNFNQKLAEVRGQLQTEESGAILSTRNANLSETKAGIEISVGNIVFKEQETWVYLTARNLTNARILLRPLSMAKIKISQAGKDYPELLKKKVVDYPLPDLVEAQGTASGALHFSALNPNQELILSLLDVRFEGAAEQFNFVFRIK